MSYHILGSSYFALGRLMYNCDIAVIMETRHLQAYGVAECEAYFEIAQYKWASGFICRKANCGHTESREGDTPFSKECKKCGRDESATANTVFDKLRISKAAALTLVKFVMKYNRRLRIEEITEALIRKGYIDVNVRSVWNLLNKIYSKMKSSVYVYDEVALFVLVVKKRELFVLSKGKVGGQIFYNAQRLLSDRDVHNFIKSHTTDQAKVAYFVAKNLNSLKVTVRPASIAYRDSFAMKPLEVGKIATKFHEWTAYIQPYLFKRNGGKYEDLMIALTN